MQTISNEKQALRKYLSHTLRKNWCAENTKIIAPRKSRKRRKDGYVILTKNRSNLAMPYRFKSLSEAMDSVPDITQYPVVHAPNCSGLPWHP